MLNQKKLPVCMPPTPNHSKIIDLTVSNILPNFELRQYDQQPNSFWLYNTNDNWGTNTFILSKNSQTQVQVILSLYKNQKGLIIPRFELSRVKIKNNLVAESQTQGNKESRINIGSAESDNFWKLIGCLSKIDEIDTENFERHSIVKSDDILIIKGREKEYVESLIKGGNLEVLIESVDPNLFNINNFQQRLNLDNSENLGTLIEIKKLKEYKEFLVSNLDKNEDSIQKWIDINKKSRCLIFGLEYINYKREGSVSSKRFDILTKVSDSSSEYVLIELKSPKDSLFEVKIDPNKNDGGSLTYSLSNPISRAIPQILYYKSQLNQKPESDPDWQKLGLKKGKISKCIIIIGTKNEDDPIWMENYINIKQHLSSQLEIITYTDLINKLDCTIKNLENNLN